MTSCCAADIASSYVKFVEMAGGRVVPIEYDLPFDEMKSRYGPRCQLDAASQLQTSDSSEELATGERMIGLAQLLTSGRCRQPVERGCAMIWHCCIWEAVMSSLSDTVICCWQIFWHCFTQEAALQRIMVVGCRAYLVLVHAGPPAASHVKPVVGPPEGQACFRCCLVTVCHAFALQHFVAVYLLQSRSAAFGPLLWHASLLQVQLHQWHAYPWGLC